MENFADSYLILPLYIDISQWKSSQPPRIRNAKMPKTQIADRRASRRSYS
jgi:hypothetical protein